MNSPTSCFFCLFTVVALLEERDIRDALFFSSRLWDFSLIQKIDYPAAVVAALLGRPFFVHFSSNLPHPIFVESLCFSLKTRRNEKGIWAWARLSLINSMY